MAASWFAQYVTPEMIAAANTGAAGDGSEETPAGAVTPQTPTSYTPAAGGKPSVPDITDITQQTLDANLGLMPDIKGLGSKVSNYFWNQTVGRVPGYEDMAAQSAANIGAQLRGEIPEDVLYQLGQGAAERGIATGGGFSNADYLRSLGLTSLGLMGEGEKGLTGALQRAESIPMFDISKYMISPEQAYQGQLLANYLAAAPDPAAANALALGAVSGGAKGTGGVSYNLGGGGGGGSGAGTSRPSPSSLWAQEWAPVGGYGTGEGPPSFTYSPFAATTIGGGGSAGVPGFQGGGFYGGYGADADIEAAINEFMNLGEDVDPYAWGGSEQSF